MPVFNFANEATEKTPVENTTGDAGAFFGGEVDDFLKSFSDEWISATAALRNSDLFAVINQLSSDLATVKLTAARRNRQGILDNPSNVANRHGFYQSIFAQLLLAGEAFAYRWRDVNGSDRYWEFIRPSNIYYNKSDYANGLYYNITFEDPKIAPKLYVPQTDVLHFRLLSDDGGRGSVSPLAALSREINIQKASDKLTLNSLKNALNANGILKIKNGGLLSIKQKISRSKQAMKLMQGGPLVLDDLEEFTPLEIKNNVAQLLSQTDWTSKQFAKVYGIPDSYLGGQGDQQSSIEMISGMYANAVSRYLRPFISELQYKLGTDIDADLFPAVDPLGATYIKRVNDLTNSGVVSSEQGLFMLQQAEIVPKNLPEPEKESDLTVEE